jgi:hypothetical protein
MLSPCGCQRPDTTVIPVGRSKVGRDISIEYEPCALAWDFRLVLAIYPTSFPVGSLSYSVSGNPILL